MVKCKKCDDTGYVKQEEGKPGTARATGFIMPEICDCIAGLKIRISNLERERNNPSEMDIGHNQVIHFVGGLKRTIFNVKKVWENEMSHIVDGDNVEWIINKNNVLMVEINGKDFEDEDDC